MAETTLSGPQHQILENDYASEWMGIEVLAISDGHATIRMTLRQEMLNGFGMAHGGMIFAFGDTAFALACNPAVQAPGEENSITVASGVDINFIRPGIPGRILTAEATRRQQSGRSGIYDVTVRDSRNVVVAEFRGHSRTISGELLAPNADEPR